MAPAAIEVLPETDTATFTIPDRLTIQNVAKRRAASGRLVAGVAAVADMEAFKGRTHHLHKGKAKRWDRASNILRSCLDSPLLILIR
jgi:aromatic amino acid aminotransferase I / 2-aminoadipate transaminase